MTTIDNRSTDQVTRRSVEDELAWTPDVDAPGIGVAVVYGVVTLSGEVDDLGRQHAAVRAAFRTAGVTTVVDDLVIHPGSYTWTSTETDLAKRVQQALAWSSQVPPEVHATVSEHAVTLSGTVEWQYERAAAVRVVRGIRGVTSVVDGIALSPRAAAGDTERRIRDALVRSATVDAERVHVTAAGTTVTLSGRVGSEDERQQALAAAWASPHVEHVVDDIRVGG
ncbi:BON domain-containing protein [Clavibacter michiganensis]|uniref:BON domain-containing protein n=1 Tax=Clavibacter michiganensis TaxID=28447 RepID=UPI000A3B6B34|nr:BON domain-containing protein [Clavibacter michiganensis]MDO4100137.1 BON domain-containing protein [Clavibacter michiganensis]MDO4128486.1 BON domain-containing protein [Clavibacter michiganensis]MWJ20353.1 BON domain-containing protein [Clavibacter michiganensis subsp. michiganensis]NIY59041.1 BON domain-containing protein [Clavibacter michiganensis subsp. michiganensis]OUD98368.1 Osmotically-inducible protein Y precursor [Clavibacter michiganensis subsp. michiganensis]